MDFQLFLSEMFSGSFSSLFVSEPGIQEVQLEPPIEQVFVSEEQCGGPEA